MTGDRFGTREILCILGIFLLTFSMSFILVLPRGWIMLFVAQRLFGSMVEMARQQHGFDVALVVVLGVISGLASGSFATWVCKRVAPYADYPSICWLTSCLILLYAIGTIAIRPEVGTALPLYQGLAGSMVGWFLGFPLGAGVSLEEYGGPAAAILAVATVPIAIAVAVITPSLPQEVLQPTGVSTAYHPQPIGAGPAALEGAGSTSAGSGATTPPPPPPEHTLTIIQKDGSRIVIHQPIRPDAATH